jgi:ubiquitin-like domain-containing CTD phosphatase 1
MDAFLAKVYPFYDIVVWSQTHWKWVELKLTELGMLTSPYFKICFILDSSLMFKVEDPKYEEKLKKAQTIDAGRTRRGKRAKYAAKVKPRHSVKALGIIWQNTVANPTGAWDERNTVHIDDLSRNFAMNPKCGLKCTAYYRDRAGAGEDRELAGLGEYLCLIANYESDFTRLQHGKWKDYVGRARERERKRKRLAVMEAEDTG